MMELEDKSGGDIAKIIKQPSRKTQYLASIAAAFAGTILGVVAAYSSPAGPKLLEPISPADGSLRLTSTQYGWFASSANLAAAFGAIFCGYSMDKLGRKTVILLASAVCVIGWVIIAAGQNFAMLMVGRVLSGMSMGASPVVASVYIAEISSPDIRGFLSSIFPIMVTSGNLWAYALGAAIPSWRWLAGVCAIPPFLCFVLMLFVKESPLNLLMKDKKEEAKETLQYFRGKDYDITEEFDGMVQFLEDSKKNKASFKDLLRPYHLKPLMISLTIIAFLHLSGLMPVLLYLLTIFKEAASGISEDLSSIIVGVVQVIAAIMMAFIIDRIGRKILLIFSAAVMAMALGGLGIYFYFKDQDLDWARDTLNWLPLLSLMAYLAAVNLGFAPLQWILFAELVSPEVKGIAGCIAGPVSWTLAFIIALLFEPMQSAFGIFGAYWFFSGMSVLALIFCVAFVPETKGKTMQQIARHFGNPAA